MDATNAIPVLVTTDTVDGLTNWLLSLGAVPSTIFMIIGIGYLLRAIPVFPTRWMWAACGLCGAVIFPIVAHYHTSAESWAYIAKTVCAGIWIGLGAWATHDKILSRFEDRIPVLKDIVAAIDAANQGPPKS
jgi:hypothetical protein